MNAAEREIVQGLQDNFNKYRENVKRLIAAYRRQDMLKNEQIINLRREIASLKARLAVREVLAK